MIRHPGRVLRVEGETAWVECLRAGPCAGCPGSPACPTGVGRPLHRLRARTSGTAVQAGQDVVVGIPPGALAGAALTVYGLPLAALLAGAALGAAVGPLVAPVGAGLGLAAALALVRMPWGALGRIRPVILDAPGRA
jgi:sigma-E factor negative regulatory protein RseC